MGYSRFSGLAGHHRGSRSWYTTVFGVQQILGIGWSSYREQELAHQTLWGTADSQDLLVSSYNAKRLSCKNYAYLFARQLILALAYQLALQKPLLTLWIFKSHQASSRLTIYMQLILTVWITLEFGHKASPGLSPHTILHSCDTSTS